MPRDHLGSRGLTLPRQYGGDQMFTHTDWVAIIVTLIVFVIIIAWTIVRMGDDCDEEKD